MNRATTCAMVLGLVALAGCNTPMNLAYDFGRSYKSAFQSQAALDRPSVAAAQYRLSGLEGTMIRLQINEQTSDRADETQQNTRSRMQQ